MRKQVILLDEDQDDWALVEDSLKELELDVSILYLSDSLALFRHLEQGHKPAFVLADFNSVPDNGLDVLKKMKGDERWQDIPVFILSEQTDDRLRSECYRHGASALIRKPDSHQGTLKKIGSFFRYWFEVVEN